MHPREYRPAGARKHPAATTSGRPVRAARASAHVDRAVASDVAHETVQTTAGHRPVRLRALRPGHRGQVAVRVHQAGYRRGRDTRQPGPTPPTTITPATIADPTRS